MAFPVCVCNTLTSINCEMVRMARSVSLKTSLHEYAEPAGLRYSDALDRKCVTSDTLHSVPLSWLFRKAALTLLWSRD